MEKRVTIAKFRRFVFSEYQYLCMHQDPSAEDINISKLTSTEIKGIGQYTVDKTKW